MLSAEEADGNIMNSYGAQERAKYDVNEMSFNAKTNKKNRLVLLLNIADKMNFIIIIFIIFFFNFCQEKLIFKK